MTDEHVNVDPVTGEALDTLTGLDYVWFKSNPRKQARTRPPYPVEMEPLQYAECQRAEHYSVRVERGQRHPEHEDVVVWNKYLIRHCPGTTRAIIAYLPAIYPVVSLPLLEEDAKRALVMRST